MKFATPFKICLVLAIQDVFCAIVNSNSESSEPIVASSKPPTSNETVGWSAEDMSDPRYCPSCCGIKEPGWMCDPDGVFLDRELGGGKGAADVLNTALWKVANTSACPCASGDCSTWNVVIFVAVVKKLSNPDGKPTDELIKEFAKELQERWWKADDTECQQEIIVAMSLDDQVITTEIGDDVLRSKMMAYDDVYLIGGISQNLHASYDLYAHVKFLITAYEHYVNHPPLSTTSTSTQPITTNNETATVGIKEDPQGGAHTLPPGIIAFIIVGILVFLVAIGISLVLPFICQADKSCFKLNK